MITRQFGIPVTSPGAILRREKDLGTPLGIETAEITQQGGSGPGCQIVKLIEDWLRLHGAHGFVFDGFPRTCRKPKAWQRFLPGIARRSISHLARSFRRNGQRSHLRAIAMPGCGFVTSVASGNFAERAVCPYCEGPLVRRNDDDLEVLQNRLKEYHAKTQPLAAFYQDASVLHRIDGNRDRETVFGDISRLIDSRNDPDQEPERGGKDAASLPCRERHPGSRGRNHSAGNHDERSRRSGRRYDARSGSEERISWISDRSSRFSGKHLYFVKRRSHSRNCQPAANSVWRYRETRYRSDREGWIGDTATTVPVGIIDERTERLLRVTERALERAIGMAHEGRRLGDISAEIEEEAMRNRLNVVREFVGHGVGRKLHEEPQIPNYGKRGSGPRLKAGMTLAIEPMINLGTGAVRLLDDGWTACTADGMPSAHFEHTVLITKEEPEILTWRGKTQLK